MVVIRVDDRHELFSRQLVCFANNNIINFSKQLSESACDSLSLFCGCLVLSSLLGGDEPIVEILMA